MEEDQYGSPGLDDEGCRSTEEKRDEPPSLAQLQENKVKTCGEEWWRAATDMDIP